MPLVFHVGPHPWPRPWRLYDRSDVMRGALGYREGTTVDIHAYADAELPRSNLALCVIALELNRLRVPEQEQEASAEIARIMEEAESLLAEGPDDLAQDFAAFIATGFTSAVADFALRPEASISLEALKTAMVSFIEIKERRFRDGLTQGRAQGEMQERARALADFVGAAWGDEARRVFQARLMHLATDAWPTIPDLQAAWQAARAPLDLLTLSNGKPSFPANGSRP